MALNSKVQLYSTNNRKKLYVLDMTGLFNANTNIGGWDNGSNTSGNPRLIDCATATAIITLPDEKTIQLNIKDSTLPYPNLINLAYEISAEACGLETFEDGMYKIKVFYSGYFPTDPVQFWSSEAASYTFFTANVACCVQKLFSRVATDVDFCKNKEFAQATNAKSLLEAIWNAIGNYYEKIDGCNNLLGAQSILKRLQYMCNNLGCGCGC